MKDTEMHSPPRAEKREPKNKPLSKKLLSTMNAYWRAANYLSVGQIYLKDNPLLRESLTLEHIKPVQSGQWGTIPGQNFIYVHLNRIIKKYDLNMIYIAGPGHGGPALVGNTYLEGTYTEVYPNVTQDEQGLKTLFEQFSTPGGVPGLVSAECPGSIQEGGELGYSLSHAFGAVFDNPELIVACVIGDGEAETAPLATAWHSNKFLNPVTDGAVLPILHLNGFKISSPALLSQISHKELKQMLRGYGWKPFFVKGAKPAKMHQLMSVVLGKVVRKIRKIQSQPVHRDENVRPRWPMIVLDSPKGWTGPKIVDGIRIKGTIRGHQIPLQVDSAHPDHLKFLENWMKSYKPEELFDLNGSLIPELAKLAPEGNRRMGSNPNANGGLLLQELNTPDIMNFRVDVRSPGSVHAYDSYKLGMYFREMIKLNSNQRNFRIFGPDETLSNQLNAVFDITHRQWIARTKKRDKSLASDGRIVEMMSEHQCEGWLEGYLLTGRHGVFICDEAYIQIIGSMFNQHAGWLKTCSELPWRREIGSLNYLLASNVWDQEHSGFSHPDPGFIDQVVNKSASIARVYLPPDANCLLSVWDHCLKSRQHVNVVIAGKNHAAQWLNMEEAVIHCEKGIGIWDWAGTDRGTNPDVVIACCGDMATLESLAAVTILRRYLPDLKIRVINVVNLLKLDSNPEQSYGLSETDFDALFTRDKPVIFAFHGYPKLIHQLIYQRTNHENIHVCGYKEEGALTTNFDMKVLNETDRFHIVLNVIKRLPQPGTGGSKLKRMMKEKLVKHKKYINKHGVDMPEILDWEWGVLQ